MQRHAQQGVGARRHEQHERIVDGIDGQAQAPERTLQPPRPSGRLSPHPGAVQRQEIRAQAKRDRPVEQYPGRQYGRLGHVCQSGAVEARTCQCRSKEPAAQPGRQPRPLARTDAGHAEPGQPRQQVAQELRGETDDRDSHEAGQHLARHARTAAKHGCDQDQVSPAFIGQQEQHGVAAVSRDKNILQHQQVAGQRAVAEVGRRELRQRVVDARCGERLAADNVEHTTGQQRGHQQQVERAQLAQQCGPRVGIRPLPAPVRQLAQQQAAEHHVDDEGFVPQAGHKIEELQRV
jgi:hypothetical protein